MPAILLNTVTGLLAQMHEVDVASRNLANIRTPGYRKERSSFHDLMYEAMNMGRDRAGRPESPPIGIGADPGAPRSIHTQGELLATGRELDLAIEGEGFFQYSLDDGTTAYSRNGSLQLDAQRRLLSGDGLPLQPEIRLPEGISEWRISSDGAIIARRPDGTEAELAPRITLVRFANPSELNSLGGYLFKPSERSGPPTEGAPGQDGFGAVVQGELEASNVAFAEEMITLLQAQRAYQMNLRALESLDEALSLANNIRR